MDNGQNNAALKTQGGIYLTCGMTWQPPASEASRLYTGADQAQLAKIQALDLALVA